MIAGSRATLVIVLGAGVLALAIGLAIGMIGGHFGGWVDSTVMRLVDIQLAFPVLVIVIAVVAVFGPSITNLILVLALASWAAYARMVRGLILSLREIEYVDAAWAAGASHMSIIVRHYLPNVATSIVILTTFEFARLVLVEAALSFLGLGVQPPTPSWGRMIAEGRQYLFEAWWASALPGLLIVLTVLSFNVIGDELRDWLDPLDDRD
jgi:peptide/nickel transport system permease protein